MSQAVSQAVKEIAVRQMLSGDLARVMEIASGLPTAPHWDRASYEAALAAGNGLRRVALVAEHARAVTGFVVASLIVPEAELESIAVAAEAQRLGVGRALLDGLIAALRMAEVRALDLEVRESNQAAVGFYARAGFREVGLRRGYYREPFEDALLLRLELSE